MQYNRQCIRFQIDRKCQRTRNHVAIGYNNPLRITQVSEKTSFCLVLIVYVQQPVSKSILFCALNDLPLSEDEDVKDYLDGKNESDNFSGNKHLSPFSLRL